MKRTSLAAIYSILLVIPLSVALFGALNAQSGGVVYLPLVVQSGNISPTATFVPTALTTPIPTITKTATNTPTSTPTDAPTATNTPDTLATLKAQLTSIAETQTAEAPTPTPTVPTPTLTPCGNAVTNVGLITVQFAQPSYSVLENAGNAVISVTLSSPAPQTVKVNYATTNDTAVADSDYISSSNVLFFNPGTTLKIFVVPILNDSIIEGNESISLTLSSPVCAKLGVPTTAALTIIDDE